LSLCRARRAGRPLGSNLYAAGNGSTQNPSNLNQRVAIFNISTLNPGRHNLRAVYAGDAGNTNSTSNTYQQIVR